MLKEYIKKVSEHHDLTTEEMKTAMNIIMDGRASSEQVSAFLIAMKMKKWRNSTSTRPLFNG